MAALDGGGRVILTMWRAVYGTTAPVEVTVDDSIEPLRDSAGDRVHSNTHFEAREDAWKRLISEAMAGVKLAAHSVRNARLEIGRAETQAANSVVVYADCVREFEQEERKNGDGR
jgi:hypothetical protein